MHHTKATKEKIRKARTGKKHTQATKDKIRTAMLERAQLVRLGILPPYRHNVATLRKMRKAARNRKPSRKAVKASVTARKERKANRQLAQKVRKMSFDN